MFIKFYDLNSYGTDLVWSALCLLVCNLRKSHGTKTKLGLS